MLNYTQAFSLLFIVCLFLISAINPQQSTLDRERKQSESLRTERDALYDELNATRAQSSQHSTEKVLLENKLAMLTRTISIKEDEVDEWRIRLSEVQQKQTEDQVEETFSY